MELKAINDKVLVRRAAADKTSPGGIVLVKDKQHDRGEVVAAGPLAIVKVGDVVVFDTDNAEVHKVDGQELVLLRDADLLAVVEPEAEVA